MTTLARGYEVGRLPRDEFELYRLVQEMWGVTIPRHKVCPDHCSPMQAFSDAFFAENTINPELGVTSQALWHGSRGLSGKSYMLAVLGLTKAFLLGTDVNLLGGSLAQSTNIHEHMRNSFDWYNAPIDQIAVEGTTLIKLVNKAKIKPLTASQRTVRGPHPATLLLDEIDEMDLKILDAALGQPMPQVNYAGVRLKPHAVLCSTWQNANGTFTEIKRRAEEKGWPIYSWCYRDTSNPIDGWLSQDTIDEKKAAIPAEMWRTEYDLGEPSIGNRAFDPDAIEATFCLPFEPVFDDNGVQTGGWIEKREQKDFWEYRFEKPVREGEYVATADWAKEQDYTVILVSRVDCYPRRVVYYLRVNRRPYPTMIEYFNKAILEYDVADRMASHDGTGLGNVVADYLDVRARPFVMTGEKRDAMLSECVNAVEKSAWAIPKVKEFYIEAKYCVGIGSLVRTLDGDKPIEQVKVGDLVLTRDGWKPVRAAVSNGIKDVVRLRASDGKEVLLTPDHSVATGRGWIEAQDLEFGDVLYVVLADSTVPATATGDDDVPAFIGVPVGAVSLSGMSHGDADASVDIDGLSRGLQMVGVHARPDAAEMVEYQAIGDVLTKERVAQPMHDGATHFSGPAARVAQSVNMLLPDPAPIVVNLDPGQDVVPVLGDRSGLARTLGAPSGLRLLGGAPAIDTAAHVLDVTPMGSIQVFDLTIDGTPEFLANGILVHNCSVGDLYGRGEKYHLPDTVCALGLAEKLAGRVHPVVNTVVVPRDPRPTKAEANFTVPDDFDRPGMDVRIVSDAPVAPRDPAQEQSSMWDLVV